MDAATLLTVSHLHRRHSNECTYKLAVHKGHGASKAPSAAANRAFDSEPTSHHGSRCLARGILLRHYALYLFPLTMSPGTFTTTMRAMLRPFYVST